MRARSLPPGAWVALALFGGSVALRAALLDGPLHGDEAVHYAVARHWGADPANVYPAYRLNEALWWQRPLFSLLYAPAAALGLVAYRVEHVLVASLLPVLVLLVARKAGVREGLAVGTGVAVAVLPPLVLWGARVVPDPAATGLVLAGLLARQARRPLAAASLLLAAAWVKETAALALVGLLAWSLWAGRARGEVRWWPLELDRPSTALVGAALLAPLPLAYSVLALGGRITGWDGPLAWSDVPSHLATAWLAVPLLAGLLWRRSRPWAVLALASVALAAAHVLAGFGSSPSSVVLPLVLGLLASAVVLDTGLRASAAAMRRLSGVAVATLVACLVVVVLVPTGHGLHEVAAPGAAGSSPLLELRGRLRDDPLASALAAIPEDRWEVVLLVDPEWYHVHHPFAVRAGFVGWAYTSVALSPADWAHAVEASDTMVLQKVDRPLNHALHATYADCLRHEDAHYAVFSGDECAGRTGRLHDELGRAKSSAAT